MRGRMGAGRDGRPTLQLRDSHADRDLGHHAGAGGGAGNRRATGLGRGRMAGRLAGGSLRTRADTASGDPVVRGVHVSIGTGAELRAVVRGARPDGIGIRRRVGGRGGFVGRSDSPGASRKGSGNDAGRLGRGMGHGCAALRVLLFRAARGDGMAGVVFGRDRAGAAGVLRAALRRGARGVSGNAIQARRARRTGLRRWRFSGRRCCESRC